MVGKAPVTKIDTLLFRPPLCRRLRREARGGRKGCRIFSHFCAAGDRRRDRKSPISKSEKNIMYCSILLKNGQILSAIFASPLRGEAGRGKGGRLEAAAQRTRLKKEVGGTRWAGRSKLSGGPREKGEGVDEKKVFYFCPPSSLHDGFKLASEAPRKKP